MIASCIIRNTPRATGIRATCSFQFAPTAGAKETGIFPLKRPASFLYRGLCDQRQKLQYWAIDHPGEKGSTSGDRLISPGGW
jgi:hypothetical protein